MTAANLFRPRTCSSLMQLWASAGISNQECDRRNVFRTPLSHRYRDRAATDIAVCIAERISSNSCACDVLCRKLYSSSHAIEFGSCRFRDSLTTHTTDVTSRVNEEVKSKLPRFRRLCMVRYGESEVSRTGRCRSTSSQNFLIMATLSDIYLYEKQ